MDSDLTVCGLGNPGTEYRYTRHNLGFWVLDALGARLGGRWRQPSPRYLSSRVAIGGRRVALIEPLPYMNLSGDAVVEFSAGGAAPADRLLVVCDDTALPLGRLRLRGKGGDGGHNGLKSIIDRLGTNEFARLRLGVGPVPDGTDHADFVLSPFEPDELPEAREAVERAVDCVELWVSRGVEAAMNWINTRPAPPTSEERD